MAVTASGVSPAATFTASNEAELNAAIAAANSSTDPSSTINFTASIPITAATAPIRGNVTVNTNGFGTQIGSSAGASLNVQGGVTYGSTGTLLVGNAIGSTGALTVQGHGTTLTNTSLSGWGGQASISVLDGAVLAIPGPAGVRLGGMSPTVSNGGVASVDVSGAGSRFVSDGATISANSGHSNVNLATNAAGSATLNIGAAEGEMRAAARASRAVRG